MSDNPEHKLNDQEYVVYRQFIDNAELEVSGRFDKWILTLSGGALGFTIVFLEKIVPKPMPGTTCLLTFSWVFFVLSISCGLTSLLTSQSAIRVVRETLDRETSLCVPEKYQVITNILNWSSAALFVAGAASFCWFTIRNMPG